MQWLGRWAEQRRGWTLAAIGIGVGGGIDSGRGLDAGCYREGGLMAAAGERVQGLIFLNFLTFIYF